MAENETPFEQRLSRTDRRDVAAFQQLQQTVFPDGKIPSQKELLVRLSDKPTIRDAIIASMYDAGVPAQEGLSKLESTKGFYKKFEKAFSVKVIDRAMGATKMLDRIRQIERKGVSLDAPFSQLTELADSPQAGFSEAFTTKHVDPLKTAVEHGRNKKYSSRSVGGRGSKMLTGAGYDIPPEVLDSVLEGIGEIDDQVIKVDGKDVTVPGQVMRDAAMVATLGYRGTDIVESRTTLELATGFGVPRPYYDPETQTVKSPPEEKKGRGRKKAGPDRPVGPVVGGVLDRRYGEAGATGELFPDIETKHITQALRDHVWPKVPKEVIKRMTDTGGRAPSDFTDIRRIIGASIANRLGMPQIAGEVLNHTQTAAEDVVDKVTSGYYFRVMDTGLEQRGQALLMFEKMMADAVGAKDAKGLADRLKLNLDPNFNAIYPTDEEFQSGENVTARQTEVSPERAAAAEAAGIQAEEAAAASLREQQTASELQADLNIQQRAEQAPKTEEAVRTLAQSNLDVAAETKTQKKAKGVARGKEIFEGIVKSATDPTKLKASMLATIAGAKAMTPGIADFGLALPEGILTRATAPDLPEGEGPFASALTDPYDIAVLKGQKFAEDRGLPPSLGAIGATVGQAVTGAVADPKGALEGFERLSGQLGTLFGAGPLRMQALADKAGAAPKIPDAAPAETGKLEAEGFAQQKNQARAAAMRGEETTMAESFLYGGIVR